VLCVEESIFYLVADIFTPSISKGGEHTPGSILLLETDLCITVKFEFSFLLSACSSLHLIVLDREKGGCGHYFGINSQKKKPDSFWGISIVLKESNIGLQVVILTSHCIVQKIVIQQLICWLVCSGGGGVNCRQMSSMVRSSVHRSIPFLHVEFDFSPPVYLSPDRVMICITICMQQA